MCCGNFFLFIYFCRAQSRLVSDHPSLVNRFVARAGDDVGVQDPAWRIWKPSSVTWCALGDGIPTFAKVSQSSRPSSLVAIEIFPPRNSPCPKCGANTKSPETDSGACAKSNQIRLSHHEYDHCHGKHFIFFRDLGMNFFSSFQMSFQCQCQHTLSM